VGEFAAFVVAACLLLEYGLAASATAIGWSDYLNNFLQNALGWQIPDALRSPLIVAGKTGGVEFTRATSTCRRSCSSYCAASCSCAAPRNRPRRTPSWY
jgi:amino acid transporter